MIDTTVITILFLLLAVAAAFFVFYGITMVMVKAFKRPLREEKSEVGFVVDTFHMLVAQLKEKEKELEALRKRAEDRAGIVEGYNENILQSVPSGVVSIDVSGKIAKANSAAERIMGVEPSGLAGRNADEVFKGIISTGGPVERGQCKFTTPAGKGLWLGFSLTPLMDNNAKNIGRLLVFTDLTELRALEAQAELRNRLSSLGEMAAGIAHELRNSMGVISGYMRLLESKVDPSLSRTVASVNKEVETMSSIVNGFLSFARPAKPSLADTDLAALMSECASAAIADAAQKPIEVIREFQGPLTIKLDRVLMKQAFMNLFKNAVEAMPEGGTIKLSAEVSSGAAHITVSDTGHGIPEGIRDKIFLPFYTTKEHGTGLGLAMVYRIITSHMGSIEAESGGRGTTFNITIPLKNES